MSKIAAPRGMHDLISPTCETNEALERMLVAVARNFGFKPIRTPIAEQLELFKRSVGEATDIVEKEMYLLKQEGRQQLALRPENTAGCVRALLQHALPLPQRLYYLGPMFRYERPQAGRFRQFHQFGVEYFGGAAPVADCEILALCQAMWQSLALTPKLEINYLGSREERSAYNRQLVIFLQQHLNQLDTDSQERLNSNPLRVLDSKHPDTQALLERAPALHDFIAPESSKSFTQLQQGLDRLGIAYSVNPRLVRGLDYYNDLVFEWISEDLGAQATICAGGRYDQLCTDLGGPNTPALGFALGIERLSLILESSLVPEPQADAVLIWGRQNDTLEKLHWLVQLRAALPHMRVVEVSGNMGKQFSKASKLGASLALIVGEDEYTARQVRVKYLRQEREQNTIPLATLASHLEQPHR